MSFIFFFCLLYSSKNPEEAELEDILNSVVSGLVLRQNPPDVGVTSGQKHCTKTIYIVLQTSVGLF